MLSITDRGASHDSFLSVSTMVGSFLLATVCALLVHRAFQQQQQHTDISKDETCPAEPTQEDTIRVAFLGNSILYFNDCPRLVESMLQTRYQTVHQDSCLRGGATLPSLYHSGNGMRNKFAAPPAQRTSDDGSLDIGAPSVPELLRREEPWDFVVLNDHTQSPARAKSRQATLEALLDWYVPLWKQSSPDATIVLLQTAAYRYPNVNHSDDLGNFEAYTDKLTTGYQEYVKTLIKAGIQARLAPVGQAFAHLFHHQPSLWHKLYSHDDFHFSPHGTWLEACVIYCTVTGVPPPAYQETWWERSRRMQPDDEPALPLPTVDEAEDLRVVAMRVCGL